MAKSRKEEASGSDDFERPFQADEETARAHYAFADRIKERLEQVGLGQRQRPRLADEHGSIFIELQPGAYFDGRLPNVLRKNSIDQLSALLSLFTNWYAYAQQQTALVSAEYSEANLQRKVLWSLVRTKLKDQAKTEGVSISDRRIEDLARLDQRFIKADALAEELEVLLDCMKLFVKVAEHDLRTVSREVSIRQIEIESQARGRGIVDRPSSRFSRHRAREDQDAQDTTQESFRRLSDPFEPETDPLAGAEPDSDSPRTLRHVGVRLGRRRG